MADHSKLLSTARRVISEEARALDVLSEGLSDGFIAAVEMILNARGRVVVSGIGKSGHIGRKLAATLASTGTPSQFVHPSEASHGDLGMVTSADVVLAISNSGEAPELANLIAYTRRFGIPLIGLSSRPESSLMKHADAHLLIPQLGEACGQGVVPTISTTMTLAIGDALAVALMEHRSFTAEHFRDFHPGGNLGAKLSKVGDLMHSGEEIPLVGLNTPMSDALLTMSQKGFGVIGIVDPNGQLEGVVTDGDLRRHMNGLLDHTAHEVMTANPHTIGPDSLAENAVAIMNEHRITCLFVVEPESSRRVVGVLRIHDCLRAGVV